MTDNLHEDEKLPFIRQIQEYYKYTASGNIYLSFRFTIKNCNETKLRAACHKLLKDHELLRTIFIRKENGLVVRKIFSGEEDFFRPLTIEADTVEMVDGYVERFYEKKRFSSLSSPPLCEILIFKNSQQNMVVFFIHHILCDNHSLHLLKYELINNYRQGLQPNNPFSFDDYCAYKNEKIRLSYFKDSEYFQNIFKNKPISKPINTNDNYLFLKDISNLTYTYNISTGKIPMAYTTMLTTNLAIKQQISISWKSICIAALLKAAKEFYNCEKSVGFMFRDDFSRYSKNTVGDYIAENYISFSIENPYKETLISINQLLLKLYRKGIYNYPMYNLNEKNITENIAPVFLNFTLSDEPYPTSGTIKLNTFTNVHIVKCHIDPIIVLYKDGRLLVGWIFDNNKISKKEIIAFTNIFEKAISNVLKIF